MKKTISIIVAALLFLASLIANVWFVFDDDPNTIPNVTEVIEKGQGVYDAIKGDAGTNTEPPAEGEGA